jgi:hypothetical protein
MQRIVMVENLDPALKSTYGHRMHLGEEKALQGERRGKWKILREEGFPKPFDGYALPAVVETVQATKARKLQKVRVGWVQDNPIDWAGGAEFSGKRVLEVGYDCGFDIVPVTPMQFSMEALTKCDVLVLNNLFHFAPWQMKEIEVAIYVRKIPFVKYEHDHREIARGDTSRRLFGEAGLNVFLSPYHKENHKRALGADGVVMPLAIDPDLFRPVPGVARKPGTALAVRKTGSRFREYMKRHPEMKFTVVWPRHPVSGANVRTMGAVPHGRMPEVYSSHEYLVHLPDGPCAGERVVLEAALCGCKIVANDNVGHTSWGWEAPAGPAEAGPVPVLEGSRQADEGERVKIADAKPIHEHVRAPDHVRENPSAVVMCDTLADLASQPDVKTVIEIGSTNGRGSTMSIREGLEKNPNFPDVRLFCIEAVKTMYDTLAAERAPYMKCYRVCSSPPREHYTDAEIERFFAVDWPAAPFESPAQRQNPGWHKTERDRYNAYMIRQGLPLDGIALVKDRNRISQFDMAFVDGGTYSGRSDLKRVYGAKYLVLDDIHTLKCKWAFDGLKKDPSYEMVMYYPCTKSHFGYAAFRRIG